MAVLENKNVFVTGGGSGIGLACARAFASDGANVLIMGRNEAKLAAAADELGAIEGAGRIQILTGDVSVEADVSAAAEQAAIGGVLDIAVANAGTGGLGPIMVTESESWDQIMQTNLNGTFYTIKHS
ncbi:uncharacterized protein METZ01_LOCUS181284, partial [marine metagenome]